MNEFEFYCGAVSSRFSYPRVVYSPVYIIKCFLTPNIFVFHMLFCLFEVGDTAEFMLIVIGNIVNVEIYSDWTRFDVTLLWSCDIRICEFICY